MDKEKYVQQIASDLLTLPEDKVVEVADFVHFLMEQVEHQGIPLDRAGLTRKQAFDLRARLSTFENDWNAPGMEAYDDL
jgi:hypothetical protein